MGDNLSGDAEDLYRIRCWGNFGQFSSYDATNFTQFKCPAGWDDASTVATVLQGTFSALATHCANANITNCAVGENWETADTWCGNSVRTIANLCKESSSNLNDKVRSSIELKFNKNDGKRVSAFCRVNEEGLLNLIGLQSYADKCLSKSGSRVAEKQWKDMCGGEISDILYGNLTDIQNPRMTLTHDANAQSCD